MINFCFPPKFQQFWNIDNVSGKNDNLITGGDLDMGALFCQVIFKVTQFPLAFILLIPAFLFYFFPSSSRFYIKLFSYSMRAAKKRY